MTISRRFVLGSAGAGILFGTSVQASSAATFAAVTSTSDPRNIRAFKLLLNGLGWRTAVDTTYTRTFYDFVRTFQRRNGLPVTGLGDEATIRFLASRRTVAADTTSWHAGALKVLLHKHGYVFSTGADATPYLTGSSLAFAQTMLDLGNFRVSAGYGHTQSNPDAVIWTRLFGAPRIGGCTR
ncbi:peptidoglycan-binding domain-containing protein [Yimella sp. NH-Cas1]|uniref:peptidoglycan-binding domain-containing protein n=1 Tax=Yimella sp. NH-Cas1 TaxID=2917726 RepID=UPI001EFB635F|nr:peptidoglycan-binding domain-containing protein [Yimella sp. NH-Cas1]MCG8656174.1 peptidoglycan-binding protein [Yimella sp. NH-Cas1]